MTQSNAEIARLSLHADYVGTGTEGADRTRDAIILILTPTQLLVEANPSLLEHLEMMSDYEEGIQRVPYLIGWILSKVVDIQGQRLEKVFGVHPLRSTNVKLDGHDLELIFKDHGSVRFDAKANDFEMPQATQFVRLFAATKGV